MDTIQKAKQILKRGHELSEEVVAINGIADELYEMRKNNDETLFQLKNIAGSLDLVSQYLYDISWELKKTREEKTLDKTTES
jgi:DNA polymerase III alpha subunit (gram-positive type)